MLNFALDIDEKRERESKENEKTHRVNGRDVEVLSSVQKI